jgi:hypothetical protein
VTIEALHWTPDSAHRYAREITDIADVEGLADALIRDFETEGLTVAGIELRRSATGPGLSIAVAEFGWALIHTDDNFDQHCTRGGDETGTVRVMWEETTEIPRSWFIPRRLALFGVTRWLVDGGLAAETAWSDDCS